MTLFQIKVIAILAMLIDHLGLFFFPEIIELRLVGRLAFPLFAWSIANGVFYTKNVWQYLWRLIVFALISQVPYSLIYWSYGDTDLNLNIFFTLVAGLLTILLWRSKLSKLLVVLILSVVLGFVQWLEFDYGAAGVVSILLFYVFYKEMWKMVLAQVGVVLAFFVLPAMADVWQTGVFDFEALVRVRQVVSLFSLGLIALYNGKLGRRMQYFFYWFYPGHLLVFAVVRLCFS